MRKPGAYPLSTLWIVRGSCSLSFYCFQVIAEAWDDEAISFAIMVCALFNFYNRWIDTFFGAG